MPKPRTATEILRSRGAFDNHPERKREKEPQPTDGLRKSPPAHLNDEQKSAWRRIVRIALPGILKNCDEIILEMAACLLAEHMADPVLMPTSRIARLERQLAKLGMSPQDRAGLEVPEPGPNPFDEF